MDLAGYLRQAGFDGFGWILGGCGRFDWISLGWGGGATGWRTGKLFQMGSNSEWKVITNGKQSEMKADLEFA